MSYIKFTKKAEKFDTTIDPIGLDERIAEIIADFNAKDIQIDTLRKEQAVLDKELRSLEFIKNQLKT